VGTASAPDNDDTHSDYEWGPAHPCFPHPNPHVPASSPLHTSTRIIRVRRDWMAHGDLGPAFANLYPEILDPLVAEDDFRALIKRVNNELAAAFNPTSFRAWADALLGVATLWLWDDVGMTAVKGRLARLEEWLDQWNRDVGAKEGVQIVPLRRTGYLTVGVSSLTLVHYTAGISWLIYVYSSIFRSQTPMSVSTLLPPRALARSRTTTSHGWTAKRIRHLLRSSCMANSALTL
jgi:hypothetical protein